MSLAREAGLEDLREDMFTGRAHQHLRDRAVLHTALRLPADAQLTVDGQDVVHDVHEVLTAMGEFTDRVRSGRWTGYTGKAITDVVNIGIGGSDLGPAMVYQALRHYVDGPRCHFVSNVDPADLVGTWPPSMPRRRCSSSPRRRSARWGTHQRRCGTHLAAGTTRHRLGRRRRQTSSRYPPMPTRCPRSVSTPPTCSASGIGSAAGTRWIRQSVCR